MLKWLKRVVLGRSEREEAVAAALTLATYTIKELNKSLGLARADHEAKQHDAMLTIACLLASAGGPVTLSGDLVEAVDAGPLDVRSRRNEDGSFTVWLGEDDFVEDGLPAGVCASSQAEEFGPVS